MHKPSWFQTRIAPLLLPSAVLVAGCTSSVAAPGSGTTTAPTSSQGPGTTTAPASASGTAPPLALVYQGPGACEGCETALADLLARAGLRTRFIGPAELRSDEAFADATLYAQPGGDETMLVRDAVGAADWPAAAARITRFVQGGGRYLGVCLGGFLAARWVDDAGTIPALRLISGEGDYFRGTPIDPNADQVIPVHWLLPETERAMYFQGGPFFAEQAGTVYARYADGTIAALATSYGQGKVAVSGVHFEAPAEWYSSNGLHDADGLDADLGLRMIQDLVR